MLLFKGIIASACLAFGLFLVNLAQLLSLLLAPFSYMAFKKINRWIAQVFWSMCVGLLVYWLRIEIHYEGALDELRDENALVIANHQSFADVAMVMTLAIKPDRLGDLKWMGKDVLKWIPLMGWAMFLIDTVLLKRNWMQDQDTLKKTFSRFLNHPIPFWLVNFPEGTRFTPSKLASAQAFAKKQGLKVPEHVLIPRPKGFTHSMQTLRPKVRSVIDVSIYYPDFIPSFWDLLRGAIRTAHVRVKRYPIESLPSDDAGIHAWLKDRFVEKDQWMSFMYQSKRR